MDEREQTLLNYIAALEDVNDQLLISLKKCVAVMTEFENFTLDREGWRKMIDLFETTIREGERVGLEKSLH